jgi:hypothetical protein
MQCDTDSATSLQNVRLQAGSSRNNTDVVG